MRNHFLWVSVVLAVLCGSCATKKQPKPRVLVAKDAEQFQRTDTVKAVAVSTGETPLQDSVSQLPPVQDSLMFPKKLTPEERVIEQKRTGIYKQADWASAIHYDLRKPNFVIIHHTSQNNTAQTVRTFQLEHTKVSAHYVIGRDGQVIQMLNDYDRGWHAGRSKWGSVVDINSMSLGIELDNNGREPFPEAQIGALLVLLDTLKSRYIIPQLNFIGHSDIAPTRKDDPSTFFPWKKLAEKGFGIWYNESFLSAPPVNFNPIDALKIIGYDMSNPDAVIRAFKKKFIVKEVNSVLTDYDKSVIYDLYKKYY